MSFYAHDGPERLKPDTVARLAECPVSIGPPSKTPDGPLVRWKAVRYALEAVLTAGLDLEQAIEQNTQWLDDVQTDIVRGLVANGVALLGASDAVVEFDPADSPAAVDHPSGAAYFDSWFQIEVTDPNDPDNRERLKIKTGQRGTSEAEAAVLLEGGDPAFSYADLMLREGTVETIDMPEPERRDRLEGLFSLAEREASPADRPNPGQHCYACARIARCGQYPAPADLKVRASDRTLWLSKTDLLNLGQCDRRSTWKSLHGIPREGGDEETGALATGLRFHDIIAKALLADDPDSVFAAEVGKGADEEADRLLALYEAHQAVMEGHVQIDVSRVEYLIGMTVPLIGPAATSEGKILEGKRILVVLMARADAVGREADGTPAVIEHRTGKNSDRIDDRETALYAVSTARLLGSDRVAVHQHALGAEGGPSCERIVYDADRLAEAEELITTALAPVPTWHPIDATAPTYSIGQWCALCPFENRCKRHR